MLGKKTEGHLALLVSKTFSGLNASGLKFLVPLWMTPLAGVTFRVVFGAIAFWAIDWIIRKYDGKRGSESKGEGVFFNKGAGSVLQVTADLPEEQLAASERIGKALYRKEIVHLLLIGIFGFYVFQVSYLTSLKYTTPVSVSILGSLLPVWTFLFGLFLYKTEMFSWNKAVGLLISIAGAALSMFSKRPSELASNPLLGDSLAVLSSVAYSLFLLYSQKVLKKMDNITMLKWSFTGAAIAALVVGGILEWVLADTSGLLSAPVLHTPFHWSPILVLLFILVFPTVLSFLLLETGLKLLPATVVASYNNVLIVVATITSLLLGQDVFSWVQMGSIALLFVGLYFIARE